MSILDIQSDVRRRAVSAFYYYNPYALLDGERCNTWTDLRASFQRDKARNDEKARHGFLHWLIAEASECEYCRIHDC